MSIEIRELHIRAVVDGAREKKIEEATGPVLRSEENAEGNTELVDLCVQKVLEILKEKTER